VNVQNIPRSQKDVKRAFVPKLDAFLFFDYTAIEVRLLAYYLARAIGDMSLSSEINNGADPHRITAQGLFQREDISDEDRQVGKTLNFSIIYGGGTPTIMRQLGVSYTEARDLLRAYHTTRPGIKLLNNTISETLAARGYIQSLYGRRLHVTEEHKALNALIQGSAADLMRNSVVNVDKYLNANYATHIVNIVHDEIILDTDKNEIDELVTIIPNLMGNKLVEQFVNINVDCEISFTNWANKEEYERPSKQPEALHAR
jgi:DNA polymerase-1